MSQNSRISESQQSSFVNQAKVKANSQLSQVQNAASRYPNSCVGKISSFFPKKQRFDKKKKTQTNIQYTNNGTAFLIGINILLTVAHNVFNKYINQQAQQVFFYPQAMQKQKKSNNQHEKIKIKAKKIQICPIYKHNSQRKEKQQQTWAYDLAIIQLEQNKFLKNNNRFLNLQWKSKSQKNSKAFILGYPEEQTYNKQIQHSTSGQLHRQQLMLSYQCTTEYGFSGAPIMEFIDGIQKVVGIHKGTKGNFNKGINFRSAQARQTIMQLIQQLNPKRIPAFYEQSYKKMTQNKKKYLKQIDQLSEQLQERKRQLKSDNDEFKMSNKLLKAQNQQLKNERKRYQKQIEQLKTQLREKKVQCETINQQALQLKKCKQQTIDKLASEIQNLKSTGIQTLKSTAAGSGIHSQIKHKSQSTKNCGQQTNFINLSNSQRRPSQQSSQLNNELNSKQQEKTNLAQIYILKQHQPNNHVRYLLNHKKAKIDIYELVKYEWKNLKTIDLSDCGMADYQWRIFVDNAKQFPNLQRILINHNKIKNIEKDDLYKFTNLECIWFIAMDQSKKEILKNTLNQQSLKNLQLFNNNNNIHKKWAISTENDAKKYYQAHKSQCQDYEKNLKQLKKKGKQNKVDKSKEENKENKRKKSKNVIYVVYEKIKNSIWRANDQVNEISKKENIKRQVNDIKKDQNNQTQANINYNQNNNQNNQNVLHNQDNQETENNEQSQNSQVQDTTNNKLQQKKQKKEKQDNFRNIFDPNRSQSESDDDQDKENNLNSKNKLENVTKPDTKNNKNNKDYIKSGKKCKKTQAKVNKNSLTNSINNNLLQQQITSTKSQTIKSQIFAQQPQNNYSINKNLLYTNANAILDKNQVNQIPQYQAINQNQINIQQVQHSQY